MLPVRLPTSLNGFLAQKVIKFFSVDIAVTKMAV